MLDKDQFAGLVRSQFDMFETVANSIYWIAVRSALSNKKYNALAELTNSANSFLSSADALADSYLRSNKDESTSQKDGLMGILKSLAEESILSVLSQIKLDSVSTAIRKPESNPVFAQLNLKRRDSIGRGYSSAYYAEVSARHFAIMADLQSSYAWLLEKKVEQIDIVSATKLTIVKTIKTSELYTEENLALFHPNSQLRIQAHDA